MKYLQQILEQAKSQWVAVLALVSFAAFFYNVAEVQIGQIHSMNLLTDQVAILNESVGRINNISSRVDILEKALAELTDSHTITVVEMAKSIVAYSEVNGLESLDTPSAKAILKVACNTQTYKLALSSEVGADLANKACVYANR